MRRVSTLHKCSVLPLVDVDVGALYDNGHVLDVSPVYIMLHGPAGFWFFAIVCYCLSSPISRYTHALRYPFGNVRSIVLPFVVRVCFVPCMN